MIGTKVAAGVILAGIALVMYACCVVAGMDDERNGRK